VVIDAAQWPEVLGTVAGDDTVFVLLRRSSMGKKLLERIQSGMKYKLESWCGCAGLELIRLLRRIRRWNLQQPWIRPIGECRLRTYIRACGPQQAGDFQSRSR
jgi:hypothetical protein